MCRLLLVKSENEFDTADYLKKFAEISKNSTEYQGHGWGLALWQQGWKVYKNIKAVWKDNLEVFGKTNILIAHARSAFKDEGIVIENNMPFQDDNYVFIFNGELRGVKIKEDGRIGAEKVFNFIKRFDKGNTMKAVEKAVEQIQKRTRYIRAMNFIMVSKHNNKVYLVNMFNEQPEYFTIWYKEDNELVICSDPFEDEWNKFENPTLRCFE